MLRLTAFNACTQGSRVIIVLCTGRSSENIWYCIAAMGRGRSGKWKEQDGTHVTTKIGEKTSLGLSYYLVS
jgi:hypothetical protein